MSSPKQSQHTLLIGYSFTLRDDGAPGNCNETIAERMWCDMKTDDLDSRPYIAVQWEIYDALQDLGHPASAYIPDNLVIPPPRFTEGDIVSRGKLLELLTTPYTPAEHALLREIQNTDSWPALLAHIEKDEQFKISKTDLANLLNDLLADGKERLYQGFTGALDLHDLHRADKGPVGLEKRRLPDEGPRKDGALRRFQAKRVNRLIVEEIIPERLMHEFGGTETSVGVLQRGQYLNVDGVATACLHQIKQNGHTIERIFVYGHPEHRDWCKSRTSALASKFLGVPAANVFLGDASSWSNAAMWDRLSAQLWCRSQGNWRYYTAL